MEALTDFQADLTASNPAQTDDQFREDVLRGLSQDQKTIPARWLYDFRGSQIFELITDLPEYYLTRTEVALLNEHVAKIARYVGPDAYVVEFGSGSSRKTQILLRAMPHAVYVPIDISGAFLQESSAALQSMFPAIQILPIVADFMEPVRLRLPGRARSMLGFFPGSTIGNMGPFASVSLLRTMRDTLGENAFLLIGMDRAKDPTRLVSAYDDARGVTASFNLNLLERINRELDGTIPVSQFRHVAQWNGEAGRIEMHLRSCRPMTFQVANQSFQIAPGETIHTENCHKYRPEEMSVLLRAGGWKVKEHWTDPAGDFSLILARAEPSRAGP